MSDRDVYASASPEKARASIDSPSGAGNRVLWFGMFGPPVVWATDLLISIAAHHNYCAALVGHSFKAWSSISILLTLLGIVMIVISIIAGLGALRAHNSVGSDDGRGNTDTDRRRFMARAGLLSSALFSYGILLRIIAPLIIPSAWCN